MTIRITAELGGQSLPVNQHSFADEKTICSVMRLMAPLLLRFGILVEFEDRGSKRSLILTRPSGAVEPLERQHGPN